MTPLESLEQRVTALEERMNLQSGIDRHTGAWYGGSARSMLDMAESQQDALAKLLERIDRLDEGMARMDDKLDKIADLLDRLAG